jgi:hypothetical protein
VPDDMDAIKELLQALAEAIEVLDEEKHKEVFDLCCAAYVKHANRYIYEYHFRTGRAPAIPINRLWERGERKVK